MTESMSVSREGRAAIAGSALKQHRRSGVHQMLADELHEPTSGDRIVAWQGNRSVVLFTSPGVHAWVQGGQPIPPARFNGLLGSPSGNE